MDEKQSLQKLAVSYLEELYDIFVKENIFKNKNSRSPQPLTDLEQNETSVESSSSKKLIRQLYDLQTIIKVVYRAVTNESKDLGSLLNYVEHFNQLKVIDVPLHDIKVKVLLEDIQNTSEDDIGTEWYEAFSKNKIDVNNVINQLLENMTKVKTQQIGAKYDYIPNQNLSKQLTSDVILSKKDDSSKTIQFEVKFRTSIIDLKSIVLRSIKDYKNNASDFTKTTNRFVVLIYTNEQDHTFNRLIAQFNRILVENDESLKDRISLMPLSIFNADNLPTKLNEYFQKIEGLVLTFDYNDSPFQHGWSGPKTIGKLSGVFQHIKDIEYESVLGLNLPSTGNYYVDYKLNAYKNQNLQRVTFVFRPKDESKIYIELSIKEDMNEYWLQIIDGTGEPQLKRANGNSEYIIYCPFKELRNWKHLTVNVREMFNKTFSSYGDFQRLEGIRLTGALDVAKIIFD